MEVKRNAVRVGGGRMTSASKLFRSTVLLQGGGKLPTGVSGVAKQNGGTGSGRESLPAGESEELCARHCKF